MQDEEAERVVAWAGESVLPELLFPLELRPVLVAEVWLVWGIGALRRQRQLELASTRTIPSCALEANSKCG